MHNAAPHSDGEKSPRPRRFATACVLVSAHPSPATTAKPSTTVEQWSSMTLRPPPAHRLYFIHIYIAYISFFLFFFSLSLFSMIYLSSSAGSLDESLLRHTRALFVCRHLPRALERVRRVSLVTPPARVPLRPARHLPRMNGVSASLYLARPLSHPSQLLGFVLQQ